MSAWMVDKVHIDLLVDVALRGPRDARGWMRPSWDGRTLSFDQADALGDALVRENLSSIHARYPDTETKPENTPGSIEQYWLTPYTFAPPLPGDQRYRMTVVEALKSVACYEYQSCEHHEWEGSQVAEFCDQLRGSLIAVLPGWDAAPWGWDAEAVAKARRAA